MPNVLWHKHTQLHNMCVNTLLFKKIKPFNWHHKKCAHTNKKTFNLNLKTDNGFFHSHDERMRINVHTGKCWCDFRAFYERNKMRDEFKMHANIRDIWNDSTCSTRLSCVQDTINLRAFEVEQLKYYMLYMCKCVCECCAYLRAYSKCVFISILFRYRRMDSWHA